MEHTNPQTSKITINTISAVVCLIFCISLVILDFHLYKIVKENRKRQIKKGRNNDYFMLLMVNAVILEIVAKTWFYIVNAYSWYRTQTDKNQNWEDDHQGFVLICAYLPVILLSTAITLNVRNWTDYCIKIDEMAQFSKLDVYSDDHDQIWKDIHKAAKKKQFYLSVATVLQILIVFSLLSWFIIFSINHPESNEIFPLLVTGIQFSLLGVAFAAVGYKSIALIRDNFSKFFEENKIKLIVATVGLSLPLLLRGALDITRYYVLPLRTWIAVNENLFNFLDFFFLDVIPIIFQLSTLVFGFIRRRMNKKKMNNTNFDNENLIDTLDTHSQVRSSDVSHRSYNENYFDPPLITQSSPRNSAIQNRLKYESLSSLDSKKKIGSQIETKRSQLIQDHNDDNDLKFHDVPNQLGGGGFKLETQHKSKQRRGENDLDTYSQSRESDENKYSNHQSDHMDNLNTNSEYGSFNYQKDRIGRSTVESDTR